METNSERRHTLLRCHRPYTSNSRNNTIIIGYQTKQ
jgi:hypothetical protein